jgi:RNA polymerase sigma factor (TIGR02999 family)
MKASGGLGKVHMLTLDDCVPSGYDFVMQADNDPEASAALPPVTLLLQRAANGDRAALDGIFSALYPDLKRLARAALYRQGRGDSMQTTMLVHESFLRLINSQGLRLQDRRHFFAYAAKVMRNLILDSARERMAECRGAGAEHLTLGGDEALRVADISASDELVQVDSVLRELEVIDPQLAELVEMRYFGGYTEVEVAELLGITERTVRRRWDKARTWLFVALKTDG